jgi:site-specific recombinase XerD
VYSVSKFLTWLGSEQLTASALDGYIDYLKAQKSMPRSVSHHIYAIRSFYKYHKLEGEFRDVVVPRIGAKRPDFLTRVEVDKLVAACETPRETAIVMLLYDTAVRVGELVTIKCADINYRALELMIKTEKAADGQDYDAVPVSKATLHKVVEYRQTSNINNGYLFPGSKGHLTTHMVRYILHQISERAGMRPIHPHSLRHSRATHIMQERGDAALPSLNRLLRHHNLATTMIYTHFQAKDIRKGTTDAFPEKEENK